MYPKPLKPPERRIPFMITRNRNQVLRVLHRKYKDNLIFNAIELQEITGLAQGSFRSVLVHLINCGFIIDIDESNRWLHQRTYRISKRGIAFLDTW